MKYTISFELLMYKMYNNYNPSYSEQVFKLKSGNYIENFEDDTENREMLKNIFGENCYEKLIEQQENTEGQLFNIVFFKDITEEEYFYYELKYNISSKFEICIKDEV